MTAAAAKPDICLHDTVELSGVGADHYAWTDADGNALGSTPSIRVHPDATTIYSVLLTDDVCQITDTRQVTVTVKPLPDISIAKSNDINCVLSEATLHARGAMDWVWINSDNDVSGVSSQDPVVRPTQTKYYYVKGTGSNGCSIADSIQVVVDHTDLSTYPVPAAFSPNGDGNNDCFRLKYWGVFKTLEMEVFNRFGQRVFYTTRAGDCWDGTLKGVPQPAGTYVYQIKATTQCGVAYRKGTVILVR
jgi:gliding motility-associated-like protein